MTLNPIARLSYLLTSNPTASLLIYRKLDRTFFSMIPFMEMFIDVVDDRSTFKLSSISSRFINSKKYISSIDCELSSEDKELIKNRVYEVFDYVEYSGIVSMWCLADIVRKNDKPFVFMPMILNYGRDKYLSHQTAFLYDRKNRNFIFYEPYGSYEKYGIDYSSLFDPMHYILFGKQGKTVPFHQLYNFKTGLQTMIIENNKLTKEEYSRELSDIKKRYDNLSGKGWRLPTKENKKFDNTIESIRIIDDVERVAIKNKDKKFK